jgi:transposase
MIHQGIEAMAQLIGNERVDDIPLLLNQMEKLNLSELADEHFPQHGNWQGLSLGKVIVGWLTYLLSQGDHRLNQVEAWAAGVSSTLMHCLAPTARSLDFSDDRLARVLDQLSDDVRWDAFEGALNRHTVRVYDLSVSCVRLDTTSSSGYRGVDAEGLFQFGHSKDHRPDLPQVKISQAALDPLGMPVSTTVVSGNQADDPLYIPEIEKVQQSLERSGLTYVGDSKMAALETRRYLAQSQNYYLCPLSDKQVSKADLAELLAPVFRGEEALTSVAALAHNTPAAAATAKPEPPPELIAEGFSLTLPQSVGLGAEAVTWREQWLVVHSFKYAARQQKGLDERIEKATAALNQLNVTGRGHKRLSASEMADAVHRILQRYRVKDLIQVAFETTTETTLKRAYRDKAARTLVETHVTVQPTLDAEAYHQAVQLLGWRVYASNDLALSLPEAVYGYRNEYLIEQGFGRYKGKALGLRPIYLASDARVKGLIRLLSVGLRILCLLDFSVRTQLQAHQQTLTGLYAGNPKRATQQPTAELLLKAFRGITLTIMEINQVTQRFLSPLSELQLRILQLLGCADDIYLCLTG